jgi:hypothetical protein
MIYRLASTKVDPDRRPTRSPENRLRRAFRFRNSVGLVSSHWRSAIMGFSSMWTDIVIDEHIHKMLDEFRKMVALARCLPVSIYVFAHQKKELAPRILTVLNILCANLKVDLLYLSGHRGNIQRIFNVTCDVLQKSSSSITHIHLVSSDNTYVFPPISIPHIPHLRTLCLLPACGFTPNEKSVATVESLQLRGDEEGMGIIEECLLVYNGWHSLKTLNLSRLLPVEPDDYPTWHTMWTHDPTRLPKYSLPSLTSVKLNCVCADDLTLIFYDISAPSLTQLELDIIPFRDGPLSVINFIQPSCTMNNLQSICVTQPEEPRGFVEDGFYDKERYLEGLRLFLAEYSALLVGVEVSGPYIELPISSL